MAACRTQLHRVALLWSIELRPRLEDFLKTLRHALRRMAGSPVLLHGDFKASNLHWTVDL
jgi:Ser/Thr protein kinase RdoA (MazF antagonist)